MSSSRSPKNIKHMVSESKQDVDNMILSLEKLKNLSQDDKSENAMLRSRIDEQSQLICILKKRADEELVRSQTLERVNNEMVQFRDQAQQIIDVELKKNGLLESRFSELAENHQEMIRFKDEYKQQNKKLRDENSRLVAENKNLFSSKLLEKDEQIHTLQKQVEKLKDQVAEMELVCSELKFEVLSKESEISRQRDASSGDLLILQKKVEQLEQELKEFEEVNTKLKMKGDSVESNQLLRVEKLTKERDELLQLSMQRGKLIQDKQKEIKILQNKVLAAEKDVLKMEDRFEREAAAVSSNIQVIKLKNERDDAEKAIKQLRMEYEAFRKHTGSMLEKERQLNAQLRNFMP
ncbi:coiled-coil domain-containing protein 89-like [Anneissia japonica]|uniref:coiled-coil domain-containing protein 89-like n=1 Tax=Anneissia japonica TaxID=1529436 RepID=UPI0014256195|nr:coiled-coil domain-containing protein 89-like [Anneissia japonica]